MKSKLFLSSLAAVLLAGSAQAQYTGNFQTNIISGVAFDAMGDPYYIGYIYSYDALIIQNGGVLSNTPGGFIGYESGASNNTVLVTGSGSVWTNTGDLYVGDFSAVGNSLTISNGGVVFNGYGYIGAQTGVNSNTVLVTGSGSVWNNAFDVYVGEFGSSNALTIASSGIVYNGYGYIGLGTSASSNAVLVTGSGSVWSNAIDLHVGDEGGGNSLTITNGGTVFNGYGYIGYDSRSSNNTVLVTGSGSVWNNINDLYVGNYGTANSLTITNGGTVYNGNGYIGYGNGANSNTVLVTGSGSVWNNTTVLYVGNYGAGDSLTIASSGTVYSLYANIGFGNGANSNTVLVTGPGSAWNVQANLTIGENSLGSCLIVTNGGFVQAFKIFVASQPFSSGALIIAGGTNEISSYLQVGIPGSTGTVTVASGALFVTNALGIASTLVDGSGNTLILGAGTFKTDNLTVTNGGVVEYVQAYQVDNASVAVAGGTVQADSSYVVAPSANSTGNISVAGGQLVATNGVIGVGNDGTTTNGLGVGTMTVSNGTVLGSSILLGSSAGGQGSLTIQTNGLVSLDSGAAGTDAVLVCNDLILDGGLLSMTNGTLYCGSSHPGAMTMSNGTALCQTMYVGYDYSGAMTMLAGQMNVSSFLVIGHLAGSTGSVWMSSGQFAMTNLPTTVGNAGLGQLSLSNGTIQASTIFVGNTGGPGGILSASGGTLSLSGDLKVGTPTQATGTVWVTGGQLLVAGGAIIVGNNSGKGQFTISNGLVQANSVVLTNGANSRMALIGGTLSSGATVVTNGQRFLVGNGSNAATFTMVGGVHWFGNGLEIANNSALTGCGTINGNVTIDSGGTVLANCGGTLTFTVIVTNNGTMRAIGGSILESYGTMVNNGTIDIINGATSFHGAFVNNGTVVNASSVKISQASRSGQDFVVQVPSVTGHTYQLQFATSLTPTNWTNTGASQPGIGGVLTITDPGGATNLPARFYRVECTAP